MTKQLSINISAMVPAIKEVDRLIARFKILAAEMAKVSQLQGGKGVSGGIGAAAAKNAQKNSKVVVGSWTKQLNILRGVFNRARKEGNNLVSAGVLKDIDKVLIKRRQALGKLGAKVDPKHLASLEKANMWLQNVSRSYGTAQASAEKFNATLLAQARTLNTKITTKGGFNWITGPQAGKDAEASARAMEGLFKGAEAATRRLALMQTAGQRMNREFTRMRTMGRRMGAGYDVSDLKRRGASIQSIKMAEVEINRIMAIRLKLAQQIRAARAAGIRKPQIVTESTVQRYVGGQEGQWGGMTPGHPKGPIVIKEADLQRLQRFGMFNEQLKKQTSWFRSFTGDIRSFIHMQIRWFAAAGLIFGAIGAIRSAVGGALEFQKAIKDIGAVTGATAKELAILSRRAMEISLRTPQSATELANLSRTLIQAGLEVRQVSAMLEDIAKVATISGEAIESVGSAFTTAVFAWKMSTAAAKKIGNTLAAALNFSRLQIEDLATAYSYVASTAHQFNLSFIETNAALAVFSNLGVRASTMATSFVQTLATLAKPPEQFKKAIEDSGVSYEEFVSVIEDSRPDKFARIFKGLADAGFTVGDAFRTLRVRTARLVAAGLNVGADAFFEMNQRIRETTQLSEGFRTAMESTSNRLSVFKNHLIAVAINMFKFMQPMMDLVTKGLTLLAKQIVRVSDGIATFGSWAAWAAGAAGLFAVYAAKLGKEIWSLTKVMAVSRAVFVTHPLFAGIAVAAGVLWLIGLIKGAKKEQEGFTESVEKTLKGMKAQMAQQKEMNRIYEDGAKLLSRYTKILADLSFASRNMEVPDLDFYRWQVDISGVIAEIDKLRKPILDLASEAVLEIEELEKASSGWLQKLFGAIAPQYGKQQVKRIKELNEQIELLKFKLLHLDTRLSAGKKGLVSDYAGKLEGDLKKIFDVYSKAADIPPSFTRKLQNELTAALKLAKQIFEREGVDFDLDMLFGFKEGAPPSARKLGERIIKAIREANKAGLEEAKKFASLYYNEILSVIELEQKQLSLKKELGLISPVEAMEEEIRLNEGIISRKQELLGWEKTLTKIYNEKLELQNKINELDRERITSLERQKKLYKAIGDEFGRQRKGYDFDELMGADKTREKEWLAFQEKLLRLQEQYIINAEQARKASERMWKAMNWDKGGGLSGFWDSVSLGVAKAMRGWDDMFAHAKRVGTDAVNALQSSVSDFFFSITTAAGYNKDEHESYWDYMQDQVDDFLKSLAQSFLRTVSEIYSQVIVSGLIKWLAKIIDSKILLGALTDTAIGKEATLTGALAAQIGVVEGLTAAFTKLGAARMFAGMGGFGGGAGGAGSGGSIGPSGGATVLYTHKGGFITPAGVRRYHSGGMAPDEKLALLQTGEFVISRKGVKALDALNRGEVSGGGGQSQVNNYYLIQANDPKSFHEYLKKHGKNAITEVVARDMSVAGPTRSAARSFT